MENALEKEKITRNLYIYKWSKAKKTEKNRKNTRMEIKSSTTGMPNSNENQYLLNEAKEKHIHLKRVLFDTL